MRNEGPQLSVIMPVYNEEQSLESVVWEWVEELERLKIDYELRVYDDGSTDRSLELLRGLCEENPRVQSLCHSNRGHGPTLLRGYREAASEWILQIDSDGEIPPTEFSEFWELRDQYDFLLGLRRTRSPDWIRRCITQVSRWTIWLLFGKAVRDVNTPYRLMRRRCLQRMIPSLPEDTFAPNVILSGLAARERLRIYQQPVTFLGRTGSTSSLIGWTLWKSAFLAFRQTIRISLKARRTK